MRFSNSLSILAICVLSTTPFSADSLNIRLLGRFTATSPEGLIVVEDRAFVANSSGGLQVLDVSDPGHPSELGYLFLPGNATGVCRVGDNIGVACSDNTFRILDASDPSDIDSIGTFLSGSAVHKCCSIGDTVYLNGGAFSVVDCSTPGAISGIGVFPDVFDHSRFAVAPPYAYLAEKNYGLSVVDISDPSLPVGAGRYFALEEYIRGVAVGRRGRIYLAANSGVFVLEWSGDSLAEIGFWASPDDAHDIVVDGIYAFVVCGSAGLRILDISDPADIVEVGYYVLGSECTDIFLDYPVAWVTGLWARVNAMDISPFAPVGEVCPRPENFVLKAYPNPFNSAVTISVAEGLVPSRIEIFDIAGRLVEPFCPLDISPVRGDTEPVPLKKGDSFTWSPAHSLPSGVYLVRARFAPDGPTARLTDQITKRVVYLK
jgi:hypothetical protein